MLIGSPFFSFIRQDLSKQMKLTVPKHRRITWNVQFQARRTTRVSDTRCATKAPVAEEARGLGLSGSAER